MAKVVGAKVTREKAMPTQRGHGVIAMAVATVAKTTATRVGMLEAKTRAKATMVGGAKVTVRMLEAKVRVVMEKAVTVGRRAAKVALPTEDGKNIGKVARRLFPSLRGGSVLKPTWEVY